MRVHIDEQCKPSVAFDETAYTAFLHGQGVTDPDIDGLNVRLLLQFSINATLKAVYHSIDGVSTITLFVPVWHPIEVSELNHALLHETRHFIKHKCLGEDSTEQKCLPWSERPCEIDAEAFASQYKQQFTFISGRASSTIYLVSSMRSWWTLGDAR